MSIESARRRPLLISGIPGVGKTEFVRWLGARGWGTFFGDHPTTSGPHLHAAWDKALAGVDEPLLVESAMYPAGFVIEWGFPARHMGTISELLRRGYDGWFFDGDRDAAFACWKQARPGADPNSWISQVRDLDAIGQQIEATYSAHRIRVLESGSVHVPHSRIASLLGLDHRT